MCLRFGTNMSQRNVVICVICAPYVFSSLAERFEQGGSTLISKQAVSRNNPSLISTVNELQHNEITKHKRAVAAAQSSTSSLDLKRIRRYAEALDPELMNFSAPGGTYDSKYRNPCWTDAEGAFRCIPHVYLLGGFHSGATSLGQKMSRHSGILTDGMSFGQFWAEDGKTMKSFVEGFSAASASVKKDHDKIILEGSQSTLAFYLASGAKAHRHFTSAFQPCWKMCSEKHYQGGEAEERKECLEKICHSEAIEADKKVALDHGFDFMRDQNIPLLMRAVYAEKLPRLVAVLRDPIDRIHSAYYGYPHYHSRHGRNPTGFLAYVKEQVAGFQGCVTRRSKGDDASNDDACALLFETFGVEEEKVFFHCDQLLRGMHAVYLERWLQYFPRSSMLVVNAEDMFRNVTVTLMDIFTFLGLKTPNVQEWDTIRFAGPVNKYASDRAMLPEARKILNDFYKPYNTRLSKLLNDQRYDLWNQPAAAQSS
ncbi:hypothetical protein CEUSTIGMA_g7884.t1 [Chlamydomonas eustigma]|uniref:Sulfotransferase n=1 Tax=Chlamydomonas eustigma TaxID=1157962 RepID=A0A250XBI2_9CHLO|nr:hypothetical protein CEUSTIGMA_g7884.t1 [Chlamydomonas eustigma]|eukprot:GAX80445.1 hypothetical protein CEUSTIGMA_g7884.t1 [Chlamydomonas eustigma]